MEQRSSFGDADEESRCHFSSWVGPVTDPRDRWWRSDEAGGRAPKADAAPYKQRLRKLTRSRSGALHQPASRRTGLTAYRSSGRNAGHGLWVFPVRTKPVIEASHGGDAGPPPSDKRINKLESSTGNDATFCFQPVQNRLR